MGAARAAPKLRLASLLGHFPTASVFRKEKLSLSALRLRRKEFPLPFCSAERGRISRDLSKLGDFFYFHFAPASLSAHKCKHSSVIPNQQVWAGRDRLLQVQKFFTALTSSFVFCVVLVFF